MKKSKSIKEQFAEIRVVLEKVVAALGAMTEAKDLPQAVTFEVAAQRLGGVSPKTLKRMVRTGQLLTIVVGRRSMIPVSELKRIATAEPVSTSAPRSKRKKPESGRALAEYLRGLKP